MATLPKTTAGLLERRQQLTAELEESPYDAILYLRRAAVHAALDYPDLAAGDAYRALLLTDEASDESFEYHEQAVEALEGYVGEEVPEVGLVAAGKRTASELAQKAAIRCYQILADSLRQCGSLRSAMDFCQRGLAISPDDDVLLQAKKAILAGRKEEDDDLPDRGFVRREVYPWNEHEPDRTAPESLAFLNAMLSKAAPKCEVRATVLPLLSGGDSGNGPAGGTVIQLGVFAKENIAPGEPVLREYSLLTANNRLHEMACDACGSGLPEEPLSCPECVDTVFCSEQCLDEASEKYHPAVCDKDVDAIAKDPDDARQADDALYVLLLARLLAMATQQERHPLEVDEVKYIWGDFTQSNETQSTETQSTETQSNETKTLPFSFASNIATPLHLLEKMDLDVFALLPLYDVWVCNTLYAKFRGTASARKSRRDGRPDVAAVHPLWCLANHDCAPNVTWEWGGKMVLRARSVEDVEGEDDPSIPPHGFGLKAGDEVLNHYCDVRLPVQLRREWAEGSLGGYCKCRRCQREAGEAETKAEVEAET